jgi:hypothetical protein
MPLGNGDIGLNVWVDHEGTVVAYLSKTDSWDENGRLLKLGQLRVILTPNPFRDAESFAQTLDCANGAITITGGQGMGAVSLRVWVDAHHPVVRLEVQSAHPCQVAATFDSWRTAPRTLSAEEDHCPVGKRAADDSTVCAADTALPDPLRVYWCHRNETSVWADTLTHQGLGNLQSTLTDPLLGRTFGVAMAGEGMTTVAPAMLRTAAPVTSCTISVYPLTAQTSSLEEWRAQVDASIAACDAISLADAWQAHLSWWHAFWERSGIVIAGNEEAEIVTHGYAWQRFLLACAGRGGYPIKFNGSIFTVDGDEQGKPVDADYRRWGGGYWFQNTRLMYWAMLMSGDGECMLPFLRMYAEALPLAEARTRQYFGHAGAFFPETMSFWGTYLNENYGYDRTNRHVSDVENPYIRRYWQGGLELVCLMLEYAAIVQDAAFVHDTLLPLARAIVTFFREHYLRHDDDGKVLFAPAQALETWHTAVNPVPEIAGLQTVLDRLLQLPEAGTTVEERQMWELFRAELPPLSTRSSWGTTRELIPALQYDDCRNIENVALYAVFPYRRYGVGLPELETGRTTYAHRPNKATGGWFQDAIHAALLGLTEDAQRDVVLNFSTSYSGSRFPAFWGPNYDWVPDQDHGSVAMIALQRMLLQWQEEALYLLPAWPRDWDVTFTLHAPGQTRVECVYRAGAIERLIVTPAARETDVVLPEWLATPAVSMKLAGLE